jgi:WD40 repeat protein
VATGSDDLTARLWDSRTGTAIAAPLVHDESVNAPFHPGINATAFSPDSSRVATGSSDRSARLWDARDGTLVQVIQHRAAVLAVAFSPDGNRLLTGGVDATARLWDVRDGRPLGSPMHHKALVSRLAFSPDGERIVTASQDQTARLWDARTAKPVGASMRHPGPVEALAISPDDALLLTTTRDAALLWDAHTGNPIASQMGSPAVADADVEVDRAGAAAFSADGSSAWTIGGRRLLLRWALHAREVTLVGAIRRSGHPVGGGQSIWIDPANPSRVRFVSALGATANVEDVDLTRPPVGFDQPSRVLERELAERFGLFVLGGGLFGAFGDDSHLDLGRKLPAQPARPAFIPPSPPRRPRR